MTDLRHRAIDLSSNNATPNLKKLYASGERVLILKATEATGYTWTRGLQLADAWHKLGADAVVWFYHFARPGNAAAQARYFLATVHGHARKGDRFVLDLEVDGVDGRFADAFWAEVIAEHAGAFDREDYGSPYFLRAHGIQPHHEEGLWLAAYAAKPPFIPSGWTHLDAWQSTDKATVPGETGQVDESVLYPPGETTAEKPAAKPAPAKRPSKPAQPATPSPHQVHVENETLRRAALSALHRLHLHVQHFLHLLRIKKKR